LAESASEVVFYKTLLENQMPAKTLPEELSTKDVLLTAKETQHSLGIGPTTLNKFVRLKWLTPVRFSKRLVRYRAREVQALIDSFAKKSGAA
jgi:predicted DNA-binding transcriptional regulator AlpA